MAYEIKGDVKIKRDLSVDRDVAIGASANDASAILQIDSTTKGLLKPRMTTLQREAITDPAEGLEVFDTDLKVGFFFDGTDWIEGGGGAGGTYTNAEPSVITVGGLEAGTTFSEQTLTQLFNAMLYPELWPTLVAPSSSFVLTQSGLHEIAEVIPTLNFLATFSRGTITPAYTTSGLRSGLPSYYKYTGTDLPASEADSDLTNAQVVSDYPVVSGVQTWTSIITHLIGEQPLGSKGTNYDSPYPAGDTSSKSVTITGVYPWFGTSAAIDTLTKQALALMTSSYVQITMIAEDGVDKQKAEFPVAWSTITGVQFYNTINSTWEWVNGSKANSLLTFTVTDTSETIQGNSISYKLWTHNGSTTGSRQLRFYTT